MNVYVYILLLYLFFSLLFLYDVKKIKTLVNLKVFFKVNFTSLTVVLCFLSMSGIPPLAGFVSKFLLFNFLFTTHNFLFLLTFSFVNFFSIYFYIQNLRFIVTKTHVNFFVKSGFYAFFCKDLTNLILFLNLLNFFNILYYEDVLYFFVNIFILKNMY